MTHRSNQVCPRKPVAKDKFQLRLAAAWGRVWPKMGGQAQMAAAMGERDVAAVRRGSSASNLPEAHKVFNSLCADPTALDEVLAEYGFRLCPTNADAANDLETAAGVINAMGALVSALADQHRDHNETLAVAQMLRPHMPALEAIICEADRLRA